MTVKTGAEMQLNGYTNSEDPDQTAPMKEQSDQDLHCLSFQPQFLTQFFS